MTKLVLDDTNSGYNLSKINSNFSKIANAVNNTILSRDNPTGDANQMLVALDMNGKNVFNAGTVSAADVVMNNVSIGGIVSAAAASATAAAASAVVANTNAVAATATLNTFHQDYLGQSASDLDITSVHQGAIYYNTTTAELKYLRGGVWVSFPQANQIGRTQLVKPTDFTTGTTVLTLPVTSYTKTILWVMQDGVYTNPAFFTLTDQTHITLTTGVGSTVTRIEVAYVAPLASAIVDDNSITTAKLVDQVITNAKLADNSVGTLKIIDNSVSTSKLVDAAVTYAKLGDNAVILHNLGLGMITGSIAGLRGIGKTGPLSVSTTGYYTGGDGGGGVYYFDASDTTTVDNGGTVIVANDGGRWKLIHNKEVSVLQFGAKGIGIGFNDTTAFQKAIATGLKVRIPKSSTFYYITDAIPCNTPGQQITGDGKDISIIQIDTGFNMAALGLFPIGSGEEGPQFKDFQVAYVQPDTTSRAALTTYPPTFYNQISPRSTMENIKIVRASYIYNMKNNAGACNFTGCEFSWFNVAIDIDGALDSIKIDRCHFWPFGLTANQQTIFYDPSTIAINTGRADDLHVDNCLFINGTQIKSYVSGLGVTFGNIVNTDFDTNNGINIAGGQLQLSGCYFSASVASIISILVSGGTLAAASCKFAIGTTLTGAQVSATGGVLLLSSASFDTGATDMSCIGVSGATALISNCFFNRTANITPAKATINCSSGRISVNGCRHSDKGTGPGSFINIVTDDLHCITGNSPVGWAITLPATRPQLVSASNTS